MSDTIAIWAEAWPVAGWTPIIGNTELESGLPWPTNSADLRHFRESTRDRLLIMGRKTFESLPDVLKTPESLSERPMVIITSNPTAKPGRIFAAGIVEWDPRSGAGKSDLRGVVKMLQLLSNKKSTAIIGGSAVIELFESAIDKLVITYMRDSYEGDVLAPSEEFMNEFPHAVVVEYNETARIIEHTRECPNETDCE